MKKQIFLLPILILALVFTGCSDDDDPTPDPVNEQEVITLVTVEMTNQENGETVTFSWGDPEYGGAGYEGPTSIAPVPHSCVVNAYNTTLDPSDEEYLVTTEILEEELDHQFFYSSAPSDLVFDFVYQDQDAELNPIGQVFDILPSADQAGNSGTFTVLLIHEPNKGADGVSSGDPTNAGGETDFDLTWDFAWGN